MSKLVKEVIGAALIVVGAITGNIQLIVKGALILGSAILTSGSQNKQAAAASLQMGEVPRQAALGRVASAGSLVDAFNHGGKYGTDWEVLVLALADHRCKGLVGLYVNDVYVPFAPTGDDTHDQNGTVPGYNDQLRVNWYPGTETQIVKQTLIDFGGWSPNDHMAGIAHVVVHYKADDEKAKNPVWTAGRPRFLFVFDGAFLYDPRKDSTVAGGAGLHRWADPTTWEWSNNPIVCRYNWVRGIFACNRVSQPDQLLVGRGLSAIEAPPENVAWRANICDELVALASGGAEPRYTFNGIIAANEQYLTTEQRFAAVVAGVIKQPEGSVEVDPGYAVTPSFFITDADFLTGAKKTFSAFRSAADTQWVNTVIPRYTESSLKWVEHGAPIRRVYADVIADGGAREATLTLPDVVSGTQAQRCGEIARRQGRLPRTGSGTLGPTFIGIEEGDWGVYTSARHTANTPMTIRVEAASVDQKWQTSPQFREMASTIYDWTVADELADGTVATANPVPVYGGAPDVSEWTATGGIVQGTNGEAIPAIFLTGGVADSYAQNLMVEYRQRATINQEEGTPFENEDDSELILNEAAPPDWIVEGSMSPLTTSYTLRGLASGAAYDVAVSYSVRGTVGDRLILGPVVAGQLTVANGAHAVRSITPAYPVTADDTHIFVAACTAQIDDGRTLVIPATTIAGLGAGASYGVFFAITPNTCIATPVESLAEMGSRDNVFLGWTTTTLSGVVPPATPPPPTYGGTDANCVVDDTLILLANDRRDGPGASVAARLLAKGMSVWTRPELANGTLGEWGAYQVTALSFAMEPVFAASGYPEATPRHRFWIDERWMMMEEIGVAAGSARVARITVGGAHTYVAAGAISHNIKMTF